MSENLSHGYDWSARGITADMVHAAGASHVFRYLTGSNGLTRDEVDAFHALGIAVVPIYETNADQAEYPERGAGDAIAAEALAAAIGMPDYVAIYYADDRNDGDPSQEVAYVGGVIGAMSRPRCGFYSNRVTLEAVRAAHPRCAYGWGVGTWGFSEAGNGSGEVPTPDLAVAQVIQLANTKEPAIPGAPVGWDVNLLFSHDVGAWLAPGVAIPSGPAPIGDDVIRRLTEDIPNVAAKGSLWISQPQRWERVDAATAGVPIQDIDANTFQTIRADQDALRDALAGGVVQAAGGVTAADVADEFAARLKS